MHRLTARLLLVLTLVGTLAPVALAFSATPPHACCMRKPMHDHGSSGVQTQPVDTGHRNCCPPVTTAQWAEPGSGIDSKIRPLQAYLPQRSHPDLRSNFENTLRPVRGPPAS